MSGLSRPWHSIRFKLLAAAIFIEVVMLSVLVWNGLRLTRYYLLTETQSHLNVIVPLMNASLSGPMVEEDLSTINEILRRIISAGDIRYIEVESTNAGVQLKKGHYQQMDWMRLADFSAFISHANRKNRFAFREPILIGSRVIGYVGMQVDISVINTALQKLLSQSIGIGSLEVFLTILFLLLAGYALTRHLGILTTAVKKVAAGNLHHRVSVTTKDEIGEVARAINYLVDEVAANNSKILSQSKEIQRLARLSPVGIFQTDPQGQCLYVNERWCELSGLTSEAALGRGWSSAIHPDDVGRVFEVWREAVEQHAVFEIECRFLNKGKDVWIFTRAEPQFEDGVLVHYIGSVTDITERKRIDNIMQLMAQGVQEQDYPAFLQQTVKNIASIFDVQYAFIGIAKKDGKQIETVAGWDGENFLENITYDLAGTPCQLVLKGKRKLVYQGVSKSFPDDSLLVDNNIESYFGAAIMTANNEVMGLISVMSTRPMQPKDWYTQVLNVFATRIGVEIERHNIMKELGLHQMNLENLVVERTTRMERLNKELESFCYSVSHDLRAPLRSISGFTQALKEDYSDQFDDEGRDYLNRVFNGANKMSGLIDDLLDLSRVTRSEPDKQIVDLSRLATQVAEELRERDPDRVVRIEVEPDMQVVGDARLLKIVLDNLMGNAWKYTARQEDARIDVGSLFSEGHQVFLVRDNGVGFDMKYASKLFGAFQRLHNQDEFEGTGIGLATVQRIIMHHSGKIWADAEINIGATFYFSLEDVDLEIGSE